MAYDLRLVKLITGEMVIGKYDAEKNVIKDAAILQTVPTQTSVQMMLLPYGYPFDQEFDAEISMSHVIYSYRKYPEDLNTKYLEAVSNLTLSTGGLGGSEMSGLIRGK